MDRIIIEGIPYEQKDRFLAAIKKGVAVLKQDGTEIQSPFWNGTERCWQMLVANTVDGYSIAEWFNQNMGRFGLKFGFGENIHHGEIE